MDIKKKFGLKIQKLRKSKGYSQEKLSEIANIDRSYLSDIERGETNISLEQIYKLSIALEITISEIFILD